MIADTLLVAPLFRTHRPRNAWRSTLRIGLGALLLLLVPLRGQCQQSQVDVSAGYSFLRAYPNGDGTPFNSNGGSASASWNIRPWLGLAVDFGGYNFNGQPPGVSGRLLTYTFGPRFNFRRESARWTPFAQFLAGGARVSGNLNAQSLSENGFSAITGGGVDVAFRKRVTFRAVELDYLLTRFGRATNTTGVQNDFRISTGIVFHFGGPS